MAICRWTDEETDDHVTGSGADQWEWYATYIGISDGNYTVFMYDGVSEDEEDRRLFRFTRGAVRSMVTKVMMGKTEIQRGSRNYEAFKDDDPDAVAMDSLIQLVVYGRIVYG